MRLLLELPLGDRDTGTSTELSTAYWILSPPPVPSLFVPPRGPGGGRCGYPHSQQGSQGSGRCDFRKAIQLRKG